MLQIPIVFTTDEKANKLIQRYLTDRCLDLIYDLIEDYAMDADMDLFDAEDDDTDFLLGNEDFGDALDGYFPEDFPGDERTKLFLGLKEMLEEEEEVTPDPVSKYVLFRLILKEITEYPEDTILPMPERDYVYHVLRKEEEEFREKGFMIYDFDQGIYEFADSEALKKALEEDMAAPSAYYSLSHIEDMLFYIPMLLGDILEAVSEDMDDDLLDELYYGTDDEEDGDYEEDGDILPFDLPESRRSFLRYDPEHDDEFPLF